LAAAAAGIVTILASTWLTKDPGRRYVRSVVGATIVTSVTSDWMLWHLGVAASSGFQIDGVVKRITLPLLIVLLAPLVARMLWANRAGVLKRPSGMDWVLLAYGTVVLVPALAIGLAHHNRMLYVLQDLGLIVFFLFMCLAGRAVTAEAARTSALEIVEALLLLAVAKIVLFGWDVSPLYSYVEAASAGAIAFLLLRPRGARFLTVGVAVALLAYDAVQIKEGANSSTAIELAGALAILLYLAIRSRRLLPHWLLVALALVAVAGFVGLTSDGYAVRGQYQGGNASNLGTTFEAHQVRAAVDSSRLSQLFGRGLGGTVDERKAPTAFRQTLLFGGRNLSHVQEVHLLGYSFLLKAGLLGVLWLAAFLASLAVLVFRGLERAARDRDPTLVLYVALPLFGVVQAFAASSRVQADPLNGLAIGILVTSLGARSPVARRVWTRAQLRPALAAGLCTLAGCVAVAYVGIHRPQVVAAPEPISLWIGDSYTAGAGAAKGEYGEAIATSVALGWQTDLDAEGGTGFVARGRRHKHFFGEPVPVRVPGDAASFPGVDVVVLDAGRNDVKHPEAKVRRAVVSSFAEIAKGFPRSAVVVIAPYLMTSKRSDYLPLRRLLRRETARRHWAFIDPIAQGWINATSAKLVAGDRVHPDQEGYDYIVAHLAPAITKALAAAHEQVRIDCTKATPCRRPASPR
jgi:lysophospholipase L1-like esterase